MLLSCSDEIILYPGSQAVLNIKMIVDQGRSNAAWACWILPEYCLEWKKCCKFPIVVHAVDGWPVNLGACF